jgi:parvulin-like peptidyl-prolyl isomerase
MTEDLATGSLGHAISPDHFVAFLKSTVQYKAIGQSILYQKLIDQVALEHDLALTDREVQQAGEQQRSGLRLERAADTLAWLADQQVTPQEWEEGIRDRLLREKLAAHLFSKEAEKRFVENRLSYDRVVLYQIVVATAELAQELFYRIEAGESSFFDVAYEFDIDAERRRRSGFEGVIQRWELQPAIATQVFNARVDELTGPIQTSAGYHILWVREFLPAELTDALRAELLQSLFQEWLQAELTYRLYHQPEPATTLASVGSGRGQ